MKRFGILLLLIILIFSCSRSRPDITYGFIQLVLYPGDEEIEEHFSFFIIPHDDDGIENLDKLYLYHDVEQLFWVFTNEDWVTYRDDYREWIGTRSITMEKGTLPRGVYRAVLVNKGGESAESSFTYDGNVRFEFPELIVTEGLYFVNSEWPANRLLCYDNAGNFVHELALTSLSGNISELNLPSNVTSVSLWAEDESNSVSALTHSASVK